MLPYIDDARRVDVRQVRPLLDSYADMTQKQARALVTSARAYQEAIWIADADPRLAWLRLVTAAEAVAALSRSAPADQRLRDALRDADPELAELLIHTGDAELIEKAAMKLADQARVKRKFVDFLASVRAPRRRPTVGRWTGTRCATSSCSSTTTGLLTFTPGCRSRRRCANPLTRAGGAWRRSTSRCRPAGRTGCPSICTYLNTSSGRRC